MQCKELLRKKQQKLANLRQKRYLKTKLKHLKRFGHVTDDVMSLYWSRKKLSGITLLSGKFSLPCDKRLTLYSPRPSLPTFTLLFITPLIFNAGRQLVIFKCPTQLKPQIWYLLTRYMLLFVNEILSQQPKKRNSEIVTWLMTPLS